MSKNSYPCFKCKQWFDSAESREAHECSAKVKPVKQETTKINNISKDEVSTDKKFNRKEAITSLIKAEIIKDRRSTTNKSDEELIEMLKDIKAL